MATIGRITVAFDSDASGLLSGIEESTSAIEKFASDVTKMADSVESISRSSVEVTTAVDTSSLKQAQREIEDLSTEIEVSIDSEAFSEDIEDAIDEINKDKKSLTIQLYAEAKEVLSGARDAAKEVRSFGLGIYRPIEAAVSAIKEIYGASDSLRKSFAQTTSIVGDFAASLRQAGSGGEGFRNSIVFAASLVKSLGAAKSGYESLSDSASGFFGYAKILFAFGSSQDRLTEALVGGGSAFASSAASAAAYKASVAAVNKATEGLNPQLRDSVRFLASLALSYGQVEIASRVSAASSKILQAVLSEEVNIAAAGAAFFTSLAEGVADVAKKSTFAADRARLYAKAAELASYASGLLASAVGAVRKTLLSFVLSASIASKSAYDFIGGLLSSARSSQVASAAYSALGSVVSAVGKSFSDSLNSFAAGRQIYSLLELSYKALASASADLVSYTKVLGTAFQAAYSALPGAGSLAKVLSEAFGELTSSTNALASSLPTVGQALGGIVRLFTVASVFSGKYRESLAALGAEAGAIQDLSDRFGSSTQELQALTKASRDAGVSMAILARGQQAVFTSIGKIKVGQINTEATREAKIAFDRLGISIQDLREKSPQDVFNEVADRLTEVQDASERSAIAFDLFGAKGAAILPALKNLKEGREDVARLGTALGEVEFGAFDDLDKSFKRVGEASKNLSRIMLLPLVPIQTGFNNFFADLQGGIAAAIAPFQALSAAAATPFQVILEVAGRFINILLRMVGAVAKVVTAFATATTTSAIWKSLGSAIKDVFGVVEVGVGYMERLASAISTAVTPAIESMTKPAENFGDWLKKIGTAAGYFAGLVAATAATKIAFAAMGATGSGSLLAIGKSAIFANLSLKGMLAGALSLFKLMTVGAVNMAANVVVSFVTMGVSAIAAWLTPFLAAVASFVTGTTIASAAATVSGYAMAAAWVVATLGIAAIVVAIIAVIQNFDSLYDYFSNFSDNVAKLFTWEGLVEAATAVVGAITGVFKSLGAWISGYFSKIWSNIKKSFANVKTPEKIDAASSSTSEIVEQRRRVAQASFEADRTVSVQFGAAPGSLPTAPPAEDYESLSRSIETSRDRMARLTFAAAAFGESGSKAAIAAQSDFDKLLQKLSEGTIDQNQFEKEAEKIQRALAENINLGDIISNEEKQKFYQSLQDAGRQARKTLREISAGSVVEGNFFPTSEAIKRQAADFERQYAERRKEIAMKASRGEYGDGEQGRENMRAAVEDADREFKRNMDKVSRETSFAEQIRKDLYSAFMSPTDAFEKRLREIANNSELTDMEKLMATSREQQRFVESTFGKTQAEQFSEREKALNAATRDGRRAISPQREAVERRKLAADRMQAAGLEVDPGLQLQLGVDKIQDAFNVAGLSIEQIQKKLSPEEFEQYQKALKNNRDAIRQNLGVEKTGAEQIADSRQKLSDAVRDGVITEEEKNRAITKQRDDLLASLGVDKSPTEKFEAAVEEINRNASELSDVELAEALESAKDKLLNALGIEESPTKKFTDRIEDLNEAVNKGRISQEEFAKGAQAAKNSLLQSLGIPLDAAQELQQRLKDLDEARAAGKIDDKELARGREEAKKALPGGDPDNPIDQFKRDLETLQKARANNSISGIEFDQRKLNLQAQLQEDLMPQIDLLRADRRQAQGSDVRSREGVDTFFRLLQGQDNPTLKAQLEVARNTRTIAQALAEPEAAPVIAQLAAR